MGMTIDEAIGWIKKSILDMRRAQICTLDRFSLETAIETMRKYQKIEEIVKEWRESGLLQDKFFDLINEVVEDGNDN